MTLQDNSNCSIEQKLAAVYVRRTIMLHTDRCHSSLEAAQMTSTWRNTACMKFQQDRQYRCGSIRILHACKPSLRCVACISFLAWVPTARACGAFGCRCTARYTARQAVVQLAGPVSNCSTYAACADRLRSSCACFACCERRQSLCKLRGGPRLRA